MLEEIKSWCHNFGVKFAQVGRSHHEKKKGEKETCISIYLGA